MFTRKNRSGLLSLLYQPTHVPLIWLSTFADAQIFSFTGGTPTSLPFKASVASEYAFPTIIDNTADAFELLEIASLMRIADDPTGVDTDASALYGLSITGGNDKTNQKLVFDGISGQKNGTMHITFNLHSAAGASE